MNGLRIAFEKLRLLAALAFAASATCMLVPGTSAGVSVGSLVGSYGCLGRTTLRVDTSTGAVLGISEIMHPSFDGVGHVKGVIVLGLEGAVCNVTASGAYSVKPGGFGSLDLTWNTATGDADGDTPCASLDGVGVAQHTALLVEASGNAFDFQSADDFLTEPAKATDSLADLSDVANPFVGSCRKQ